MRRWKRVLITPKNWLQHKCVHCMAVLRLNHCSITSLCFSTAILKSKINIHLFFLMPAPGIETNIPSVNNHIVHRQQENSIICSHGNKNFK